MQGGAALWHNGTMTSHPPLTSKMVFGLPIVLFFLLAANVLPELVLQLADRGVILSPVLRPWAYTLGAFQPDLITKAGPHFAIQPLSMFLTYGFLHTGLSHLIINMIGLVWLGRLILSYRTPETFLIMYLMSMVGAAEVCALIGIQGGTVVGASGAIFGLFGAYLVDSGLFGSARSQPEETAQQFFLLSLATAALALSDAGSQAFLGSSPTAWQAHAGGFLTGAVVALLTPPRFGTFQQSANH